MTTQVSPVARERAQNLMAHWDWPDPAILEDILALGEEALPAVAELLTPERLEATHGGGAADAVVFYCIQILAALRNPQAIPLLVGLFSQVDDDLVESLPDALYPFGEAVIDPLLPVIANESLGWYPRAVASDIATTPAKTDPAHRARIAAVLRPIVADYIARSDDLTDDEQDTLNALAGDLVNLADPDSRPMIEAALAEDKIDTNHFDQDYVDEVYQIGGRSSPPPSPEPWLEQYREDWQKHQAEARLKALEAENLTETIVVGRRLGRNDPCWCGSGKKYKKCHLAADEKAGRA